MCMRACVILAGGDLPGHVNIPADSLVICADCGLRHAKRLGIVPDILIGDLDSFTEALPAGIPVLRLPVEKDVTDTMQAVLYGAEQGCREFHIYGVFGGARIDHSLANIQVLHMMYTRGLKGVLHHGSTTVETQSPEDGTCRYPRFNGDFSVFALTDTCGGLTIRGCKYCVEDIVLRSSFPLGVSNCITADFGEISIRTGLLLIVQVRYPVTNS